MRSLRFMGEVCGEGEGAFTQPSPDRNEEVERGPRTNRAPSLAARTVLGGQHEGWEARRSPTTNYSNAVGESTLRSELGCVAATEPTASLQRARALLTFSLRRIRRALLLFVASLVQFLASRGRAHVQGRDDTTKKLGPRRSLGGGRHGA
jgi:hypothetical protein